MNQASPRAFLELATELERIALEDEYFVGRKLYPMWISFRIIFRL